MPDRISESNKEAVVANGIVRYNGALKNKLIQTTFGACEQEDREKCARWMGYSVPEIVM